MSWDRLLGPAPWELPRSSGKGGQRDRGEVVEPSMGTSDSRRKVLPELNARLEAFPSDYLIFLMHVGMSARAVSQQERNELAARKDELANKVAETQQFFSRHKLEFPPSVQTLIETLRKEMKLTGPARQLADSLALLDVAKHVEELVGRLRKEIARHVR